MNTSITWATPLSYRFITLVIISILIMCYYLCFKRRIDLKSKLVDEIYCAVLLPGYLHNRQLAKLLLLITSGLLLCFALLRPQWGYKKQIIKHQGRDLLIALDISRSMLVQDVRPTRLEAAKQKIKELVTSLDADRIGLILFAGSAVLQCPLTADKSAFFMFLDSVDGQTVTSSTTALDSPIKKALEVYKNISDKKNKLLVIFTDGEDFSGSVAAIRQEALNSNLQIFTEGIGTEDGAPVPKLDQDGNVIDYERSNDNNIIMSKLNEDMLRLLATDTGGKYISFSTDNQDVKNIVSYIEKYEKEQFEEKKIEHQEDRYYYFVSSALLALLIEWLI